MGTHRVSRGRDAWTWEAHPYRNYTTRYIKLSDRAGERRYGFVHMALAGIRDQAVISATLSARVRRDSGITGSQTLNLYRVDGRWSVNRVDWRNMPGGRADNVSVFTDGVRDGDRVAFDVTSHLQQVANGAPWWGWLLTTTGAGGVEFYGFRFADSWELVYEVSDVPLTPETLRPDGGVISEASWVASCDFTDTGDGSTEQASMQVQVDPGEDEVTPAFDTGEVATTLPALDLATTPDTAGVSYPGLADAATTAWRVRVTDTDGYTSDWSDWATVARVVKPALTITDPFSGDLYDPTPVVTASLASGEVESFQVLVREHGESGYRFYTGREPGDGPTLGYQLPARGRDGRAVFRDGRTYDVTVRVWDRTDRVSGGPDDPPYIDATTTVVFDVDGAQVPPTIVSATPEGTGLPKVRLRLTRGASPDRYVFYCNGDPAAFLDALDIATGTPGEWEWVDEAPAPNTTNVYTVRAVTDGRQSPDSASVSLEVPVRGLWLLTEHGDVVLTGTDVGELRYADRRATFELPGRPDPVDIVSAHTGIAGTFEGALDGTEAEVRTAKETLEAVRFDPATPVRLVYGTVSVPFMVRNLSVTPASNLIPELNRRHVVRFGGFQCGEFED